MLKKEVVDYVEAVAGNFTDHFAGHVDWLDNLEL